MKRKEGGEIMYFDLYWRERGRERGREGGDREMTNILIGGCTKREVRGVNLLLEVKSIREMEERGSEVFNPLVG